MRFAQRATGLGSAILPFAVTSPIDGQLVNGSLNIAGTFSTDKKGVTVSVAITLGQLTVLTASTSAFSGSFSLAGVTPATYTHNDCDRQYGAVEPEQ
jgi:hypothetical protein